MRSLHTKGDFILSIAVVFCFTLGVLSGINKA